MRVRVRIPMGFHTFLDPNSYFPESSVAAIGLQARGIKRLNCALHGPWSHALNNSAAGCRVLRKQSARNSERTSARGPRVWNETRPKRGTGGCQPRGHTDTTVPASTPRCRIQIVMIPGFHSFLGPRGAERGTCMCRPAAAGPPDPGTHYRVPARTLANP